MDVLMMDLSISTIPSMYLEILKVVEDVTSTGTAFSAIFKTSSTAQKVIDGEMG
jgi:hypothetical protein